VQAPAPLYTHVTKSPLSWDEVRGVPSLSAGAQFTADARPIADERKQRRTFFSAQRMVASMYKYESEEEGYSCYPLEGCITRNETRWEKQKERRLGTLCCDAASE